MALDPVLEKIDELGPFPALDAWQREQVLLVRTGDITPQEFSVRMERKMAQLEELHRTAQPSSMDSESYLVAQSYYQKVSESLDLYLVGIEELQDWIQSGDSEHLQSAQANFEIGDEAAHQAFREAVLLELQAREIDEEILRQVRQEP